MIKVVNKMGYYIVSGIMLVIAMTVFFSGMIVKKSYEKFQKEAISGKAVVEGYHNEEGSTNYSLIVKLKGLEDGGSFTCRSKTINCAEYPVDSVIDVLYRKKPMLDFYEIHLNDGKNNPTNPAKVSRIMTIISGIFLIFSIIIVIIGLI